MSTSPPDQPVRPAAAPPAGRASSAERSAPGTPTSDPPAATEHGELQPLPHDGVASVAVGTVLWLVALLVMLPFTDDLREDGRLWWIATAAVGFGLGLAGVWVVVRRRNRLRAAGEPTSSRR